MKTKLKIFRESMGLTQKKMAIKLNTAQVSISRWELRIRRPGTNTINKILAFAKSQKYRLNYQDIINDY